MCRQLGLNIEKKKKGGGGVLGRGVLEGEGAGVGGGDQMRRAPTRTLKVSRQGAVTSSTGRAFHHNSLGVEGEIPAVGYFGLLFTMDLHAFILDTLALRLF